MLNLRILVSSLAAIVIFTVVAFVALIAQCSANETQCSGGMPPYFVALVFAGGGLLILLTGLLANFWLSRLSVYRPWQAVPIYAVLAVLVPRAYLVLTGSDVDLTHFSFVVDGIFALSGLAMGLIMFVFSHQRSNNSFKPSPLRGSA